MKHQRGLVWVAGRKTPAKTYITRVFNFGTLQEWKQLKKRFSKKELQEAVKEPLQGQWTRHGKAFAEALFHAHMPDRVLLSYEAKPLH